MSYDKINFVDGQVLTADQLNHMESGIERAIPNPDTAAVGQTIRVSAVDDSGKPTAWEAVDFPSGGGGGGVSEWEIINEVTTAEAVGSVSITTDAAGGTFDLSEVQVDIHFPSGLTDGQSGQWYFYFAPQTKNYTTYDLENGTDYATVRYNKKGKTAILAKHNKNGTNNFTLGNVTGETCNQFRMQNWSSLTLPEGTIIRVIGRRA